MSQPANAVGQPPRRHVFALKKGLYLLKVQVLLVDDRWNFQWGVTYRGPTPDWEKARARAVDKRLKYDYTLKDIWKRGVRVGFQHDAPCGMHIDLAPAAVPGAGLCTVIVQLYQYATVGAVDTDIPVGEPYEYAVRQVAPESLELLFTIRP